MSKNLGNQTEFAAYMGVSKVQAHLWAKAGRLILENGNPKLIIFDQSKANIEATEDLSKTEVKARHARERAEKAGETEQPETAAPIVDDLTGKAGNVYQQSKAMREKYNAMLTKIEYDKAIGQLLDVNEVKNAIINAALITRSRLENLPSQLSTRLAVEQDERQIHNILTDTIEHVLTEFSRSCAKVGQQHESSTN